MIKRRYLFSETIRHSVSIAETDCRWERKGKLDYVDNHGVDVRIISSPEQLRCYPPGTEVYLGYCPQRHHEWELFRQLELCGRIKCLTPDLDPEVSKAIDANNLRRPF